MERFIKILIAIFSLIFYTFLMVLVDDITIQNQVLKLLVHFGALVIVAIILYFIIKFILKRVNLLSRKNIYKIVLWNFAIGLFFPVVLIILIPNEKFTIFSFMLIVSTIYYGVIINIIVSLLNHFKTK